jgi:hypothetical protein
MAWGRSRRRRTDHYRDLCTRMYGCAQHALFYPVRDTLAQKLTGRVHELVDKRIAATQPLIAQLTAIDRSIYVGGQRSKCEIEVRFLAPGDYNESWLSLNVEQLTTKVSIPHATTVGSNMLSDLGLQPTNPYNTEVLTLSLPFEPPYKILDAELDADSTESIHNMLSAMRILKQEFPTWTRQFRTFDTKSHPTPASISNASYFSSTFSIWATELGRHPKIFLRRPRIDGENVAPMPPALNSALSLAHALYQASKKNEVE